MLSPSKLKYLRLLHNLTQTDIAKELHVTKNYISQIENGKLTYSQEQHNKIVNAIYKVSEQKKKQKENVGEILTDVTKAIKDKK